MPERSSTSSPESRAFQQLSYIITGVLLCVVAVVVLFITRSFPETSLDADIGAGAFPQFYAWLLIFLSAVLIFQQCSGGIRGRSLTASSFRSLSFTSWSGPLYTLILCILYIIAMDYLGYLASTVIFMGMTIKLAGMKRVSINLLLAVVLSVVLYLLFSLALNVPLPESSLFESLTSE
ncbi:TPA: tripartite tricarboxylate transporter TctB family protein [Serratia odorifera]|nr:tripartite tricarboxylate transporter TctB family protein [Serratia odorifera]